MASADRMSWLVMEWACATPTIIDEVLRHHCLRRKFNQSLKDQIKW